MKNHLPALALVFCLGIIFAGCLPAGFLLFYCPALLLLAFSSVFFNNSKLFAVLMLCLVFLSGAAIFICAGKKPPDNIGNHILYKSGSNAYFVKGAVVSGMTEEDSRQKFLLRTTEIQLHNLRHTCSGNILVRLSCTADLHYGQELLLRGSVYRNRFCPQGVSALMNISMPQQIIVLKTGSAAGVRAAAFFLKEKFRKIIYGYFNPLPASIIEAMVLGEKTHIPRQIYDSMIKTGTVHILVVSGFNTGVVAFVIILILKLLRLPPLLRALSAAVLLVLYCFIAGASTPVVRATVMALVLMPACFFRRQPEIYNSLALAALFILAFDPRQLFNIGFQLSFISVLSIVFFYPRLSALSHIEKIKNRMLKLPAEAALVSLSAWLGTAGFIAYYFRIVSPVTIFANLLIVPLSSLVTLCGFATVITAAVCPVLARLFALSTELLVLTLLGLNHWFVRLPLAYFYLPQSA